MKGKRCIRVIGYVRDNVRSGPVISGRAKGIGNSSGTFVTMFGVVLLFLVGQRESEIVRVLS